MKKLFLSRPGKAFVDVLLLIHIVIMFTCHPDMFSNYWQTSHCMAGISSSLLMIIHVWQHAPFIRALTQKKFMQKSKITALTTLCFILIIISILFFTISFTPSFLKYHHIVGHLFAVIVIIHIIQKFKRFLSFCKK